MEDIAKAVRVAAENITDASAVNAGIGRYVSINEAAEAIFDQVGWEPEEINFMTDKPEGVRHRAADTTRAENRLGWEPEYNLGDGLSETLEWYRTNRDKEYVRSNLETLLHER